MRVFIVCAFPSSLLQHDDHRRWRGVGRLPELRSASALSMADGSELDFGERARSMTMLAVRMRASKPMRSAALTLSRYESAHLDWPDRYPHKR